MRKIPTNSFYSDVMGISGAFLRTGGREDIEAFEEVFARYVGAKVSFLVDSGTTALYVILKALRKFSDRNEVILPAYTVPTLTLAIERAGLETRLAEIDPKTFNMDPERLTDYTTPKTLAVVPVHMFGFPMNIDPIKTAARREGFFVIEDAAQAPGAEISGKRVGGLSEVGLFSLCKGKIISTFRGGVVTATDPEIAREASREIESIRYPHALFNLRVFITLLLLSWAVKPEVYGSLYPLISRFKSTSVHTHFAPGRITPFIARLAGIQLSAIDGEVKRRRENGTALLAGLRNIAGIRLPLVAKGSIPSFNHLPLVIESEGKIEELSQHLFTRGIDTARMYLKPIHHIYDIRYPRSPDPFPHAASLARRLLVLPTHSGVTERDRTVIIETTKELFA
jgi:perosamine synthetase